MNYSVIMNTYNEDTCDVVYIATNNYFFGVESKYGLHYPCHHCRLFKKSYIEVTGEMHNYLKTKENARKLYVKGENKEMIHFPYNNTEEWLKKRYRYIDVETENKTKFISPLICCIKSFNKFFFLDKNYKGGYEGFMLSVTQTISEMIADVKVYYDNKNIDIEQIKNKYLDEKNE